jgi:NADH dehydrogenase FAD-containing subunit
LIAATGLKPAAVIRTSGLPTDAAGALLVNDQLQSVADPHIFGGGDCVTMSGHNLQRVGVYAVRQSAVLAANLLAALEGRPLQTYRPQRRFLQILNLGDGTGLAVRDRLWWRGRSALWLKERLDYRFMTWGRTPEK